MKNSNTMFPDLWSIEKHSYDEYSYTMFPGLFTIEKHSYEKQLQNFS